MMTAQTILPTKRKLVPRRKGRSSVSLCAMMTAFKVPLTCRMKGCTTMLNNCRFSLLLCIAFLFSSCIHPVSFDETKWREEVEKTRAAALYNVHVKNGVYFNPWMPRKHIGFMGLLKWKLSSKESYTPEEKAFKPQFVPDLKERIEVAPEGDFIVWIGHATFLMRIGGKYFLTDPMVSERALIPKRVTPPALSQEDIGAITSPIDVLISHNHYDHMDRKTIQALPPHARFIVPMGLKVSIEEMRGGRDNSKDRSPSVFEMDWWQTVEAGQNIKIVCLPAQHWSRRLFDGINTSLWASYMIITPNLTIYYGGDSGYFIGYREFGKIYPQIDYALIPTTAVHPRWFMHYAHMSIDETIDAFEDLGARRFIPTQWGTFPLGDEPPGYPAIELKRRTASRGLDPSRFIIMNIGEILPLQRQFP